jgi:membrane protein DedA with SNARE-associated domain
VDGVWVQWGTIAYGGAALWAFLEGETFVLIAAAAGRAAHILNPVVLTLCVWIGSFAGDQLWFTLGRRYGRRALRGFPSIEARLDQATQVLERYGIVFVLGFRFAYGVRNAAAAACGIAGMNRLRFLIANFIAAGIWAATFVAAGWYVAVWLGHRRTFYLLGSIGLLVLGWLVVRLWRRPPTRVAA